jgi:hypothetical protein
MLRSPRSSRHQAVSLSSLSQSADDIVARLQSPKPTSIEQAITILVSGQTQGF